MYSGAIAVYLFCSSLWLIGSDVSLDVSDIYGTTFSAAFLTYPLCLIDVFLFAASPRALLHLLARRARVSGVSDLVVFLSCVLVQFVATALLIASALGFGVLVVFFAFA